MNSAPEVTLTPIHSLDLIRSRGLLVDVLKELQPQRDALTVVGAHAVLERTKALEPYLVSDATRDADLGVTPELLSAEPLLGATLRDLGLEEASQVRPGVWGLVSERDRDLHDRLTIDLIAPASLAGPGRRAAKVGPHGARAVSKTAGTELTVIDRSIMRVGKLDTSEGVDAYVAGHGALLCAKAYKLFDRLDERERVRNPERLRTKDAADMYRLMATSAPGQVRETFDRGEYEPAIAVAVRTGRERLLVIREPLVDLAVRHYRGVLPREVVEEAMNEWLDEFGRAN
ncbi:hypothetical protein ROT00_07345 [Agromyces mediolanus]|uniref:hypothetical protein n=1 Tax=Agromyces mediolanus TaxID=41986 RepID=UPI003838C71C